MVNVQDIYPAYLAASRGKHTHDMWVEFDLHLWSNLFRIVDDLNYKTLTNKCKGFIQLEPRPREILFGEPSISIVCWYFYLKTNEIYNKLLTDHTFHGRQHMGVMSCIDAVMDDIFVVSKGYTEKAWVILLDIENYFPSANHDIAFSHVKEILSNYYDGDDIDELLHIAQIVIYYDPKVQDLFPDSQKLQSKVPVNKSIFSSPDGKGGCVGYLLWQQEMTYYINDIDHFVVDNFENVYYERYADDICIITPDNQKDEVKAFLIPCMREMLAELGLKFNDQKFYCQPYTVAFKFLGSVITVDRIRLRQRTIDHAFAAIARMNKKVRQDKVPLFLSVINSYINILKQHNEQRAISKLLERIDLGWYIWVDYDDNDGFFHSRIPYKKFISSKYGLKLKTKKRKNTAPKSTYKKQNIMLT